MTHKTPVSFIATEDPDAARAFYTGVLGLELVEASPYALIFRDAGHRLRVQIVPAFSPPPYTAYGWQVTDIVGEITALVAKGVALSRFDALPQDALGIWTTPDGHKIAWFTDPSGNILSLTEPATP